MRRQASTFVACAFCALLIGCGGPSWPGGIHAVLASSARGLRAVEVPEDSPAFVAGLRPGDAIVAIDGKPVAGLSSKELHEQLSGEVGSWVELRVLRDGTEQTLRVKRAPYAARR